MKTFTLVFILVINAVALHAQNLFPEKYNDCALTEFCLDCGDTRGGYPGDLNSFFLQKFTTARLKGIEGSVFVQVLIDTTGHACVMSIGNKAVGRIARLDLRKTINAMSGWTPAVTKGKKQNVSITLRFDFVNEAFRVLYQRFNADAVTNMKSEGEAEILNKSANSPALKNTFEVFTTENSVIPWDMSRAIVIDKNNIAWLGTDNGIVKIENGKMTVINSKNSLLRAKRNETTIMNAAIDIYNNKWFSDGYNTYKYDDKSWTVFDSLNSPTEWTTGIYADNSGNVWFAGFDGLIKYDGKNWSVMDTSNSKLPSNRIMGVFADSKKRLWIGTDKGNIRIDGNDVETFQSNDNPLKTAAITKGYEDKNGNIWFALHEKYPQKKGFAKLSANGNWTVITTDNSKIPRNDVLDFAIDENTNTIWLSINRVGITQYRGSDWATFTPDNSKVPSTYIQAITLDKNGVLWCATFAGLLKVVPQ